MNTYVRIMKDDELAHFGVLGMKWGRRKAPQTLTTNKSMSSVTKKVIKDYNTMDDAAFAGKYHGTKKTYAKRVAKYGDPYMNAPLAKFGKKMAQMQARKAGKYSKDIDNNIEKMKLYSKKGLKDKDGNMVVPPEDVQELIKGLEQVKQKRDKASKTVNKGKSRATTFLEKNGKKELWEFDSDEELDLFEDLKSTGGFDEYLDS